MSTVTMTTDVGSSQFRRLSLAAALLNVDDDSNDATDVESFEFGGCVAAHIRTHSDNAVWPVRHACTAKYLALSVAKQVLQQQSDSRVKMWRMGRTK
jgi:hypothetical protein